MGSRAEPNAWKATGANEMSRHKIDALRRRDGGLCQLCFRPIDFSLAGTNHRMAPSVDHIIPKSKGGKGTRDNLRLAHACCNGKRGNGPSVTFDVMMEALEYFAAKGRSLVFSSLGSSRS